MLHVDFRASAYWVSTLMSYIPAPLASSIVALCCPSYWKGPQLGCFIQKWNKTHSRFPEPGVKATNCLVMMEITEHVPFLHKERDCALSLMFIPSFISSAFWFLIMSSDHIHTHSYCHTILSLVPLHLEMGWEIALECSRARLPSGSTAFQWQHCHWKPHDLPPGRAGGTLDGWLGEGGGSVSVPAGGSAHLAHLFLSWHLSGGGTVFK